MLIFRCLFILCSVLCCCSLQQHNLTHIFQGCYDSKQFTFEHKTIPNQGKKCFDLCFEEGLNYAGINERACYCDSNIMEKATKIDDSGCLPCSDDADIFCGDSNMRLSIYLIKRKTATDDKLPKGHQEVERKFEEEPLLLLEGEGGIYSYNYSDNRLISLVQVEGPVDSLDYHLRRKEGFAIWSDCLWRFPLFTDKPLAAHEVVMVDDVFSRCRAFAVDWVHDKVYWPDCYVHNIMVTEIDEESVPPTSVTVVKLRDEGAWALDMKIDPYKGLLFWTTGATLWSIRLDGRGLTKVVPAFPVNCVSTLSLDLTNGKVYFYGQEKHKNSSGLRFAQYNGQVSHVLHFLEYDSQSHLLDLFVGYFDSYIYYIKSLESNNSVVMAAKLEFNQRHENKHILKGIQPTVARLVHPRLQDPGEVDKCTDWGCSHLCLLEHALPRCHCPRHHELEHDNKTCVLNPGEEEEAHIMARMVLGLLLVLVVLLAAGVLMCICDVVWSRLRPSVVRLSNPTAAYCSSTVERLQDSENFI